MKARIAGVVLALLFAAVGSSGAPKEYEKVKEAKAPPKPPRPGMVLLALKLPRPLFIGTPKNLRTPNLEPDRKGKLRPPFFVDKDVKKVSLEKPVASSDAEPVIGEIAQVTDGDREGREGSYVELGPGKQHVQIDLGKTYEIHVILVWHYHGSARVYRDMVVQVSDDSDFILDVATIFNNDHDNSSGFGIGKDFEYIETFEGKLVDCKGVKARYVRLYSNGSTAGEMNHYVEVEVYGR